MFRCCIKRSFYCVLWPLSSGESDILSGTTKTEQVIQEELKTKNKTESGWDRVKKIFQKNDFGGISAELGSITQVACMSSFVGAIYGGINYSKEAYIDFIKNNQATAFKNHLDAKRKLQDAVTTTFAKGAFKWAWRVSLFSTSFVGTYTIIQTYRNKTGVIEYVVAGMTSGFLYKFTAGPRAWVVGAGLGGVLGLVAGGLTNALLALTGMTMDEARLRQNYWQEERLRYDARKTEERRQKEENVLLYKYSQTHADAKIALDDLENKTQN